MLTLSVQPTFLGIVIALFFQCIGVLLSPANPTRRGIKWGLVAHTVAMFSCLTIPIVIDLHDKSVSYTDNRNFPGNDDYPSGPLGYELLLGDPKLATFTVFACMFPLNQWLADGLLVGPISNSVALVFNVGSSSCTVVMSFIP